MFIVTEFFDLLHYGHVNHFEEAKKYGDILVVTITSDEYVNKGPNRPAFSAATRMKFLTAIEFIDYIALSSKPSAADIIKNLRPNFYCKGPDYIKEKKDVTGMIKNEKKAIHSVGGKIIFTKGETYSSSFDIKQIL